jgi:hypothetical protein
MAFNMLSMLPFDLHESGTSCSEKSSGADDVDFQELFREYFNDDNADLFTYTNSMAQLQAQALANSLPTGQGIRTAWHSDSGGSQQPFNHRCIEENLYLPTGVCCCMQVICLLELKVNHS